MVGFFFISTVSCKVVCRIRFIIIPHCLESCKCPSLLFALAIFGYRSWLRDYPYPFYFSLGDHEFSPFYLIRFFLNYLWTHLASNWDMPRKVFGRGNHLYYPIRKNCWMLISPCAFKIGCTVPILECLGLSHLLPVCLEIVMRGEAVCSRKGYGKAEKQRFLHVISFLWCFRSLFHLLTYQVLVSSFCCLHISSSILHEQTWGLSRQLALSLISR